MTALNGDPRKEEVAFAQAYFVTQTRKFEVLEARISEIQRLGARNKLKVTEREFNAPLSDVLPSVTIKAKDLATEITTVNTKKNNLQGKYPIKDEHTRSNKDVREVLVKSNIKPEELPAEEDIKKVVAKHKQERTLMERRQRNEVEAAKKRLTN